MTKKTYSVQFKKQVVEEFIRGKTYQQLCDQYGLSKGTLYAWIQKYREECQEVTPTNERRALKPNKDYVKELREKNQRISELEKENAFLKKAAAFFAQQTEQWCIGS